MTKRVTGLIGIFLGIAVAIYPQVKKPETAPVRVPFERSLQAVVVTTSDWSSFRGKAWQVRRKNPQSRWTVVGVGFPVVIGRNGLGSAGVSSPRPAPVYKSEGDGRSPAGQFPLTLAFGGSDKVDWMNLPYTNLDRYTECVDDVNSSFYNRIVNRMHVGNFDWKSSEQMLEVGEQYDLGVFVAYNSYPVIRGNGSCIFLHIWKDAETGTSGCTAMSRADLERVVRWLDPAKNPYLVQMTEVKYNSHRKNLRLPVLK